ncbi:MAG: NADH-quinone oxidoreductase subunit NuoG [Holosporales bacterium]
MPSLSIDGKTLDVPAGLTVIQACELAGVEIPRFCYHERLAIAGNCRMCLVEMEKAPKPVASCAMPVSEGMVIRTNTPLVKKAREGVMELLLLNHPLDCPICDQGGECDLQDQAMAYGKDAGRTLETRRAVPEKYMGPLIKTIMTRCIHCTRCVRFSEDVAGVDSLGAIGRGELTEITTLEQAVASELSGNIVDLCPVGALTSRPYAFNARPWELRKTESIDVMDAMGSNIRIDTRGSEVLRVLPRLHEDINEEWLADKGRHACDGLKYQRLDRPYVRRHGQLVPVRWDEALKHAATALRGVRPHEIAAIAGDLVDVESVYALRVLLDCLGTPHRDCRPEGNILSAAQGRSGYLFNTGIAGIEQVDALLLVGSNPRWEAPLLNARIRKRWLSGKLKIAVIGAPLDLTYPYKHLGTSPAVLATEGVTFLKGAKNPAIILGQAALQRPDSEALVATAYDVASKVGALRPDWNGYNILHIAAGRVGALDAGFLPGSEGANTKLILTRAAAGVIKIVYLLGADEIDTAKLKDAFVIYQGHHGDAGASVADIVFPGAAYTEKNSFYINTEGRAQQAQAAVPPPGEARVDTDIILDLASVLGVKLPFSDRAGLLAALIKDIPAIEAMDETLPAVLPTAPHAKGSVSEALFAYPIDNYYMTDPISRVSKTMAQCTRDVLPVLQASLGKAA